MENSPWKIIFIATGSSLLLLFLVYIIVLPKGLHNEAPTDRIANFKNTHVAGHEKGVKQWEFYAKSGWVDKDRQTTYLEDVTMGSIYKDGDLITKNLVAPKVKAFPNTKAIEAYGEGKTRLSAEIAFMEKKNNEERKFAKVYAESLKYNPSTKTTTIAGNVRVKDPSMSLRANQMIIDNEKEMSDLSEKVYVNRKDITLSCNNMHYDSKDERVEARGDVRSTIKGKQKTNLNADFVQLFVDTTKDVNANGNVEVVQGKKTAVANSLFYNKSTEVIMLSGEVKAVISKGRALLKEDTIGKLHNPDARKLLEEKTFISSDNLDLSTKNGDALASGNVVVTQSSREARSNVADYSDATESIILTDNVYLKKDKAWVKCRKINISVKNETFTAIGSVEAEFKIWK